MLHIMAKKQYTTCFLPELERRAEAISWEFNSPEVAKGDCDDKENAGGADVGQLEWRTEAIVIRGVQVAGGCKRVVDVCDDRDKGGEADDGAAGAAGGTCGGRDIRGVKVAGGCKHYARGCGRVSIGVRRAPAFFDMQVSSGATLMKRQSALLGMGSADAEQRKEAVLYPFSTSQNTV
jgi:hypothetical protein